MIEKTPIFKLANRFKLLNQSVAWYEIFKNNHDLRNWIVNEIKDRLRREGTDINNDVIGYYSELTSRINPKKKANTHFTLEDTGEMFRSMFIDVSLKYISILVNDNKIRDQRWYSNQIFNLNDEELSNLVDKLKPLYIEYVKKIIFAK